MPGISFKCDLGANNRKKASNNDNLFLKALDSTVYNASYKEEVLLNQDSYLLGSTKYRDYPIKIFEDSEFWICIEGVIYGKASHTLAREIHELMYYIFYRKSHLEEDKKIIVDWLLQTDGDFVIFALDKKNKDFAIINDVLGRLPLYYYYLAKGTEIIVSREVQFISSYLVQGDTNNSNFDRMGLAQLLLFCHTLGRRTLLTNVSRLDPASIIRIDKNDSQIKIDSLYRFNFDNQKYATDTIKKNAEKLASLLSEACKNRVNYNNIKNVISLSGGLDSRAVAACFHKNSISCYAATLVHPSWAPAWGNSSEEEVARQIAELFRIKWQKYVVEPTADDVLRLLKMKNGLSYLAFSSAIPFLKSIKNDYWSSPITLFTGHGGGIILSNITPKKKIRSLDELASHIIKGRGHFPLGDVAALLQIKESEIVDELKSILSSYPEKKLNQKYVHYLFYENELKLSFESEDINRFFFWSVSPFFSLPFFHYAINCAAKNKLQHALYRELLFMLSPPAAAINDSNWGCSVLSKKYRILQFVLSLMYRYKTFRKVAKKIKDSEVGYNSNSKIIKCMRYQINNCSAISDYLWRGDIEKILNNCSAFSHTGIDNLFTIMSLIEKSFCNGRAIESTYEK